MEPQTGPQPELRGLPPVAVVVDGYGAGNFYPAAFARLDAQVVHLQSTPELIPTMMPPDLSGYLDHAVRTDEESAVGFLRRYAPVCVVPGQESSVEFADRVSELLWLPSNGSRRSLARRDKYEMIEALRSAGLRCANQFRAGDRAALLDWVRGNGAYPVVVKPVRSAGTDGVYICRTEAEVAGAVDAVLASRNIFGEANGDVLVQSYLDGPEYIVDTVSCDGQRYVCGVWRYEKTLLPSGKNIYDRDILMDPDDDPVPELISYVDGVLDALDIRWGPAHAEVILTRDGPALVEVGARLNGNMHPGFHDVCVGANQADLTAKAFVRPEEFVKEYGDRVYQMRQPAVVYNVPTTAEGVVRGVDVAVVDQIRALPSVHLAAVKLRPGDRIRPTTDLLSSPVRVYLTGADEARLTVDYRTVKHLKDSIYRVG